jgi:hypothetical protein
MTVTVPIGGVDSKSRKEAVRKYFRKTPDSSEERNAIRLMILGAAVAIAAVVILMIGPQLVGIAIGLLALVALSQGLMQRANYLRKYAAAEPKPSDSQMDQLLRDDIRRAAGRALKRLGLTLDELELRSHDVDPLAVGGHQRLADQGRGPIAVFGPTAQAQGRIGIDRKWRFTRYDIMVICPTGHHLGIYECVLDLASGRRRDEETNEYHYADVVAVRTTTTATPEVAINVLDPSAHRRISLGGALHREFQIIVSSGDRSSIIVGIKDDDEPGEVVLLQESGIESVIEAVRRMLRAKKGGVVPTM